MSGDHSVALLCETVWVSRSGYYAWLERGHRRVGNPRHFRQRVADEEQPAREQQQLVAVDRSNKIVTGQIRKYEVRLTGRSRARGQERREPFARLP